MRSPVSPNSFLKSFCFKNLPNCIEKILILSFGIAQSLNGKMLHIFKHGCVCLPDIYVNFHETVANNAFIFPFITFECVLIFITYSCDTKFTFVPSFFCPQILCFKSSFSHQFPTFFPRFYNKHQFNSSNFDINV